MQQHRYSLDLPHDVERIWTLMQDYGRWADYAPMVTGVEVMHPGDASGNGLLRRVQYKMPLGRTGTAIELVTDVRPNGGYTYRMIGRQPGQDQTGTVTLESLGPGKTRLHFEERYHLDKAPWKWFEARIYKFINKQNEASMQALSDYLTAHPEYAPQ
jgi:hypothetical protein